MQSGITVFDRKKNAYFSEKVLGEGPMRFLYESLLGKAFLPALIQKPFSVLYGTFQNSFLSRKSIPPFIQEFCIPMEEFENQHYRNFNDFFIRKFKPGMRTFSEDLHEFPAFAEGRYFAFDAITDDTRLPVKGITLNISALLGDSPLLKSFHGGPGWIARLCPVDYHRFHFPDSGRVLYSAEKTGPLHSVNPIAMAHHPDVLFTNERHVQVLETDHFGKIAYVEVGALGVGKIKQSFDATVNFKKGEEKGYFLFGGSTVIVICEPGKVKIDPELLEKTKEGIESLIRLGEPIGSSAE